MGRSASSARRQLSQMEPADGTASCSSLADCAALMVPNLTPRRAILRHATQRGWRSSLADILAASFPLGEDPPNVVSAHPMILEGVAHSRRTSGTGQSRARAIPLRSPFSCFHHSPAFTILIVLTLIPPSTIIHRLSLAVSGLCPSRLDGSWQCPLTRLFRSRVFGKQLPDGIELAASSRSSAHEHACEATKRGKHGAREFSQKAIDLRIWKQSKV